MKKTELKAKAARYVKIVEWSDEDRCFVGTCPGLMFGGVHGTDEAKVYAELCQATEEVISLMESEGHRLPPGTAKPSYSGKVLLRLEPAVHQRLALQAQGNGESLNAFLTRKLVAG
ncbi:MAG TPA: toxin-antitoxin system HicB family antitoxin [Verrucomicrobiota bacterium]|nr:toxin-antitoxin system HicB family antitoxin [Verrucomicrobiales bacterium]HRI11833.1 toxin-antitoxin system HicB family antitoxin [Verrucomicrobiota bacterium]